MRKPFFTLTATLLLAGFQIAGCPSTTTTGADDSTGTTGTTGSDDTSLTTSEQQAIEDALTATEALTNATTVSQSSTDTESESQNAQLLPEGTASIQFGNCPVVTAGVSNVLTGNGQFDLTLDFGDGCSPLGQPDYTVSGSFSGSLSNADNSLSMDFNELQITEGTFTNQLDGSLEGSYTRDPNSVELDGQWDLTYEDNFNLGTIMVAGEGTARYERTDLSTNIVTYSGTLSDGEVSFSVTMTNVKVSYAQNGNFVPMGGTITISGSEIRTITITFSEDTPQTGEVTVSIGGAPPITVSLDDFIEYLADLLNVEVTTGS
ncbi:MAG: hypothetical protein D6744_08160 [Planctomycetota bacterium]|nr:MAG: hypothetical protein D6744_08160 [Planctomycetota bacterium]